MKEDTTCHAACCYQNVNENVVNSKRRRLNAQEFPEIIFECSGCHENFTRKKDCEEHIKSASHFQQILCLESQPIQQIRKVTEEMISEVIGSNNKSGNVSNAFLLYNILHFVLFLSLI